jgi:hypothetical protein
LFGAALGPVALAAHTIVKQIVDFAMAIFGTFSTVAQSLVATCLGKVRASKHTLPQSSELLDIASKLLCKIGKKRQPVVIFPSATYLRLTACIQSERPDLQTWKSSILVPLNDENVL